MAGLGMTHLPRRRDVLEKEIRHSLNSFNKDVCHPGDEVYTFALEDTDTGAFGGTCAIYAKIGVENPFYVYQIEYTTPRSERLPPLEDPRLLRLTPYYHGPSEIGGLFLCPEYRKGGLGKLLSLSRFLFMACHTERFETTVIANMRGVIENNVSLFWNGLGRHFLNVELHEVMSMRLENNHLISDILPTYPIYAVLLSPPVQNVIGQVHQDTVPALHMLYNEGFHFNQEIDPVDGGPILATDVSEVHTVKSSRVVHVGEISTQPVISENYLISNIRIDFRACQSTLQLDKQERAVLSAETANALQVKVGDSIRYIPCKTREV